MGTVTSIRNNQGFDPDAADQVGLPFDLAWERFKSSRCAVASGAANAIPKGCETTAWQYSRFDR